MNQEWQPPEPHLVEGDMLITLDPRVDVMHSVGVLPCPGNPPPPKGWEYWKGSIPDGGTNFATLILKDPAKFPMGSFVQTRLHGSLLGARVEWHNLQGSSGIPGCFRGVNLMRLIG